MSSSGDGNMLLKPEVTKALFTTVFAGILDRIALKEESTTSNVTFALSVGVSSFFGTYIGESLASTVPAGDIYVYSQKNLFQRVVELGVTGAGGYAINKYALKNDYVFLDTKKIGVIVLSSIMGEYASDYLSSKALGYLS